MTIRTAILSFAPLMFGTAVCARTASPQEPPRLGPEAAKALQEQERSLEQMTLSSKKENAETFSVEQCRDDTQAWTLGGFSSKGKLEATGGYVVVVNGQSRLMPFPTSHTTIPQLLDRIHEMTVCERVDADFEKQFGTYSTMREEYQSEHEFRYLNFLIRHNLFQQFLQEDAADNK